MNINLRAITRDEYPQVVEWANEFNHPPTGRYDLQLVSADGVAIGYVETIRTPVLAMGWKPGHSKQVITAIRHIKAGAQLSWGECLAVANPLSDIYKHLNRIGFKSCNVELVRGE